MSSVIGLNWKQMLFPRCLILARKLYKNPKEPREGKLEIYRLPTYPMKMSNGNRRLRHVVMHLKFAVKREMCARMYLTNMFCVICHFLKIFYWTVQTLCQSSTILYMMIWLWLWTFLNVFLLFKAKRLYSWLPMYSTRTCALFMTIWNWDKTNKINMFSPLWSIRVYTVSRIVIIWIIFLYFQLKELDIWQSREIITEKMPADFDKTNV